MLPLHSVCECNWGFSKFKSMNDGDIKSNAKSRQKVPFYRNASLNVRAKAVPLDVTCYTCYTCYTCFLHIMWYIRLQLTNAACIRNISKGQSNVYHFFSFSGFIRWRNFETSFNIATNVDACYKRALMDPLKMTCFPNCSFLAQFIRGHRYCRDHRSVTTALAITYC